MFLVDLLMGMLVAISLISIAVVVVLVISYWKIFEKAGESGWKALVPVYSEYVMYKIGWEAKWFLISLALIVLNLIFAFAGLVMIAWIPSIGSLVIGIIFAVKLAEAFGKSGGFAVGLIFLPVIFFPILAFGSAQYVKGQTQA